MYADMRPLLAGLLTAARQHQVLVIHVQNTALPDRMSDSPAQIRFNLRMHQAAWRDGPALRCTMPGTPGYEFVPALRPLPHELVVPKYRSSSFWGTNLDLLLRSKSLHWAARRCSSGAT